MRNAALSLALALGLTACTGTMKTGGGVTYMAPEGVQLQRVAILPVMSAEGLEGFRRAAADTLAAAVMRARPDVEVISATVTLRLLNDAELADDYSRMLQDYQATGILDKQSLQAMAAAVQADYFLHLRVSYGEECWRKATECDIRQVLDVSAHIWGSEKGDVVWEASATAERTVNEEIESRRPMGELLAAAYWRLMLGFPQE